MLTITNLKPTGEDNLTSFQLDVPVETPYVDLLAGLEQRGFQVPQRLVKADGSFIALRIPMSHTVRIVDGPSDYNQESFQLNKNQSFAEFFTRCVEANSNVQKSNKVTIKEDQIHVDNALKISFMRTLRVPDNNKKYELPPGLGRFPITPVNLHMDKLPQTIVKGGGFFFPMMQREAMWISFDSLDHSGECAVKVVCGDVNAINGECEYEDVGDEEVVDLQLPLIQGIKQNYASVPRQPWLDGFNTGKNSVRQFIAMPLGNGYTVSEQIKGQSENAAIRFEVYKSLNRDFKLLVNGRTEENIFSSPVELGLSNGDRIHFQSRTLVLPNTLGNILDCNESKTLKAVYLCTMEIIMKTLTGQAYKVNIKEDPKQFTVLEMKMLFQEMTGIPVDQQRLICSGQQLDDDLTIEQCDIQHQSTIHMVLRLRGGGYSSPVFGMAAGGKITQKIYMDKKPIRAYDLENPIRFNVHILNSQLYQLVTGDTLPTTPISARTYSEHNFPWFSLYDEKIDSVDGSSKLKKLMSVSTLDDENIKLSNDWCIEDPELVKIYSACKVCNLMLAEYEIEPCNHLICGGCHSPKQCAQCLEPFDTAVKFSAQMGLPSTEAAIPNDICYPLVTHKLY